MMAAAPPQPERSRRIWLIPAVLALLIIVADQATKQWAMDTLGPIPGQRVITLGAEWLRLVYGQNTGVAFGLFRNLSQLFTVTSILITAGAIYAYAAHLPNHSRWVQAAMGLIVGGAIGNITDRLRLGFVVDFISVGWWPVFNVADSAVTVGVTMLAGYLILIGDEPQPRPELPARDDRLLGELLGQEINE